jgi:toxin YoeB
MGYRVEYLSDAKKELLAFKKAGNKLALARIERIEKELKIHPEIGIGRPEKMKHGYSGFWSREVTQKDRMVYKIVEDTVYVYIHMLMYHYDDK